MAHPTVDLRSDTVTHPTDEMRRAMAAAPVGDDGYGEDPTVNELEALYAERVGKDAAVFVPSGTMANQIAVRALAGAGTAVVAGRHQHIVAYELGAAARNSSVQLHMVDDADGTIAPDDVALAIEATDYHQPEVSLVCVENTHMAAGGIPWDLAALKAVVDAAAGRPVHMDGARLFNAEVATGVAAAEFAAAATTVMSCLSKGLCAPVGSVLAGPADVIEVCRFERKRLGGAMRQAGVIAAAGILALRDMVGRLDDDHTRARLLAEAVADRWPDAGCNPEDVRTNIVLFAPPEPERVIARLDAAGVLSQMVNPGVVRFMTHRDIDDDDLDTARRAIAAIA